jgi:ribosomal protein S18 acetylase RimI-like enzyme
MEVREARADDEAALRAASSAIEVGSSELKLNHVITNDFFARIRAHGEATVLAAFAGGEIVGSVSVLVRDGAVGGEWHRIGYMFHLFVVPEHRRSGVAARLVSEAEATARDAGAELMYLAVEGANEPAQKLFSGAEYELHRVMHRAGFAPTSEKPRAGSPRVRPSGEGDLPAACELVNATWAGHDLFHPLTAETLRARIEAVRGMNISDVLLVEEGGAPRACCAIWDSSDNAALHVRWVAPGLRLLRAVSGIVRAFRPIPRIPKPGEVMKPALLVSLIGYDDVEALHPLFDHINNLALDRGISMVFFMCEKESEMPAVLENVFRADGDINLYTKSLAPGVALSDGPVFGDTFEVF